MVEIKYFKQFLLLFFPFQLFCSEVRAGSCQPGCELTETIQRAHAEHTCTPAVPLTHLGGFYVEHLGKGGTKSEDCNCMFKASSRAKMQLESPSQQHRTEQPLDRTDA